MTRVEWFVFCIGIGRQMSYNGGEGGGGMIIMLKSIFVAPIEVRIAYHNVGVPEVEHNELNF